MAILHVILAWEPAEHKAISKLRVIHYLQMTNNIGVVYKVAM